MFTGVAQKNLAVAKSYFDEHLSHNDYYTQGEVEQGKWLGLGCEALGLQEGHAVDREKFMSLCDGLHPEEGSRLTQRLNGAGNRRVFYDFTCSAPKSVSLMAVTMKDERILHAHQEAARLAMKELEAYAAARIRVQGADADRRTGNVVGAEFLHNSSRALDPQLHTHFTLFNATFDHTEKRWKALQTFDMFEASKYGTEVYRNELAKRLAVIGYEVENRTHGFEIKGVSRELLKRFSKRSAERDAVIAKMKERLGRELDNNEVSVAVHRTRSRKLKGITTEEVRQIQLDQMTQTEIASLRAVQERASGPLGPLHSERVEEHASLDYAAAHVFERSCVVSQEELLRHALIHGRGQVALSLLKSQLEEERFVRVGGEISTREILTKELGLIEALDSTRANSIPLAPQFVPSPSLGEDQRAAITHVLQTHDQFTGFRGLAGAGKTTALQEIAQVFSRDRRPAIFCALSATAAEVLRKEVSPQAVTLAKLLVDPKEQEGIKNGVIVLDEAGLVGLDDMHALFSLALERNARVILSGDTGQHSGVARGDALRLLEEHSIYRAGHLDQIRRQQEAGYREVVELAASQHPQEALDRLDTLGKVVEPEQLYKSAAGAFLEAREQGRSALLVAPTWAEIDSVTQCVRSQLQEKGLLSKQEEKVAVFDALGWTEAQKSNPSQYAPGMRILFGQTSGHFQHHEEVEVVKVAQGALQVRKEDGSLCSFRPRTGASFQVGERREIAVAPGDELLLQANRSKEGLLNGQVVTVKTVQEGKITLTDGRSLPENFREFTHGYCVTSHSSQARTVDSVFLVASSRSAGAIHREQFYVSISRGRQECRVFTDDKELLRDRIARSTHRQAALDLLGAALRKEGLVAPAIPGTAGKSQDLDKIGQAASLKVSRLRSLDNLPVQRTRDLERVSLQEHCLRVAQRTFHSLREFSQKAHAALEAAPERSPGHSHHITHDQELPGRSQERSHSHDRGPSLER